MEDTDNRNNPPFFVNIEKNQKWKDWHNRRTHVCPSNLIYVRVLTNQLDFFRDIVCESLAQARFLIIVPLCSIPDILPG